MHFAPRVLLILQSNCGGFCFFYLSMFSLWTLRCSLTEISSFRKHIPPATAQGRIREDTEGASDAQQEIGERSYFTKRVVSSRDLGVGINVLQIPGEGLAAQGVAEAFAGGNVPIVHPHHTCRQIFFFFKYARTQNPILSVSAWKLKVSPHRRVASANWGHRQSQTNFSLCCVCRQLHWGHLSRIMPFSKTCQ